MKPDRYNTSMANQFLGLSLFIMLLSFFIVLNSLSTFEEDRAKPIINSLAVAFSTSASDEELDPSMQEDTDTFFKQGSTLDKIKGLFKAQIAGVKATQNRLGTMMQIRLPQEEFEAGILVPLREPSVDMEESFATLLVSLMNTATGQPYRVDIVLNLEGGPVEMREKAPEDHKQKLKTVAKYADELARAGLPSYQLSAGLGQGKPGTVDLLFRPYVVFNPVGER